MRSFDSLFHSVAELIANNVAANRDSTGSDRDLLFWAVATRLKLDLAADGELVLRIAELVAQAMRCQCEYDTAGAAAEALGISMEFRS